MHPSRMANEISKMQSAQQRAEDRNLCDWSTATPRRAIGRRQRNPHGRLVKIRAARDAIRIRRRISETVEFAAKPQLSDIKPKVQAGIPPSRSAPPALFFSRLAPYIRGAGSPAMEINGRRNKPFGPGGSTRRLHPSPPLMLRVSAGAKQDRRGRKGRVFSRYGSAVIGLCNSCKRQLCSGCSGCVTQFERPSLKSWWVKLR
jgi:hypothetical protein